MCGLCLTHLESDFIHWQAHDRIPASRIVWLSDQHKETLNLSYKCHAPPSIHTCPSRTATPSIKQEDDDLIALGLLKGDGYDSQYDFPRAVTYSGPKHYIDAIVSQRQLSRLRDSARLSNEVKGGLGLLREFGIPWRIEEASDIFNVLPPGENGTGPRCGLLRVIGTKEQLFKVWRSIALVWR